MKVSPIVNHRITNYQRPYIKDGVYRPYNDNKDNDDNNISFGRFDDIDPASFKKAVKFFLKICVGVMFVSLLLQCQKCDEKKRQNEHYSMAYSTRYSKGYEQKAGCPDFRYPPEEVDELAKYCTPDEFKASAHAVLGPYLKLQSGNQIIFYGAGKTHGYFLDYENNQVIKILDVDNNAGINIRDQKFKFDLADDSMLVLEGEDYSAFKNMIKIKDFWNEPEKFGEPGFFNKFIFERKYWSSEGERVVYELMELAKKMTPPPEKIPYIYDPDKLIRLAQTSTIEKFEHDAKSNIAYTFDLGTKNGDQYKVYATDFDLPNKGDETLMFIADKKKNKIQVFDIDSIPMEKYTTSIGQVYKWDIRQPHYFYNVYATVFGKKMSIPFEEVFGKQMYVQHNNTNFLEEPKYPRSTMRLRDYFKTRVWHNSIAQKFNKR